MSILTTPDVDGANDKRELVRQQ